MSEGPPEPLPQREDAERCQSVDDTCRRCVLPPGHQGVHIYPREANT